MKHMTACFVGLSFAMAGVSADAQTVAFDGPKGWIASSPCDFSEYPADCGIAVSSSHVAHSVPPAAPYYNTADMTDCWYSIASTTSWPTSISVTRREKVPRGGGANANVAQFYPAVIVNQAGTVVVGFSRSWQDPSAPIKLRGYLTSDPNDNCGKPEASSGHKQYRKGRWGDFSGIALDPDDDCSLWLFNMYARMPVDPVTCADCAEPDAWWGTWVQKWSGGCDFADRPGGGGGRH